MHDAKAGIWRILNRRGDPLGSVMQTAPFTNDLIGYSGSNDVLIVQDLQENILGLELLHGGDSHEHVIAVRNNADFWSSLSEWSPGGSAGLEVDAVSGSTLTSLAIAEAVETRLSGRRRSLRFPEPVAVEEARFLFPLAFRLEGEEERHHLKVFDQNGVHLGNLLRTSPFAESVRGYAGPTEVLLALSPDLTRLVGIRMRTSYDTPEYVQRLQDQPSFWQDLAGIPVEKWPDLDYREKRLEGVSGATQTSYAVVESIRRRLTSLKNEPNETFQFRFAPEGILLAFFLASLWMNFGAWRRHRGRRRVWQWILIAGLGLYLGQFLTLAWIAGWAREGYWLSSNVWIPLFMLGCLAVPLFSGKSHYCRSLCPHGAAQEQLLLVGKFRRQMSASLRRKLRSLPALLLIAAWLLALKKPGFDLTMLEAFDGWVLWVGAGISFALAILGLLASLFWPMAYCRFACPTGALLKFLQGSGRRDHWRRADSLALGGMFIGLFLWQTQFSIGESGSEGANSRQAPAFLQGHAFGTTWQIKLRGEVEHDQVLRADLRREVDRIEKQFSSWRPNSETSVFNRSESTLPIEVSTEFLELVQFGLQLSQWTNGAFDLTVAPWVDAWGAGPAGEQDSQPAVQELSDLRDRIGWQKLKVDPEFRTLQKLHPELRLDLGALLQGYAVDRIADILLQSGVEEALIEVGGELRALGSWAVAIEDPRSPGRFLYSGSLTNASLATTGLYRNSNHLISTKTAKPVEAPWLLCSVEAVACLQADGWATALFTSSEGALELVERHGLRVWLLDSEGLLHETGTN